MTNRTKKLAALAKTAIIYTFIFIWTVLGLALIPIMAAFAVSF